MSAEARVRRVAGMVVLAAAGFGLLLLFDALSWRAFGGNSDDANAVLAGHALIHGNVLLHGWQLPTDTYWPIDLPMYGLASVVAGVRQSLIHAVPAAIATVTVAVAVAASVRDAPAGRRWVGGAVNFALLGLPAPLLAAFMLQGPMHIGTTLYCLVAFLLIDPRRFGWRWWAGVCLLAAAVAGDPVAIAIGAAPLAGAAVVARRRSGSWRASSSPLVAAAVSVAGAGALRAVVSRLGGYTNAPPLPLSPAHNWGANIAAVPGRLGALLGASGPGPAPQLWAGLRWVHWAGALAITLGVALASAAVLRAVAAGPRSSPAAQDSVRESWCDDLFTLAFWGCAGAFVLITLPHADLNSVRYLVPAVVFGSVVAGRLSSRLPVSALGSVGSVGAKLAVGSALLAYAATPWVMARAAVATSEPRPLAAWLAGNHLQEGFGPYWDASIVTVMSQERVKVRPVIAAAGRLHALAYFASARWFEVTPAASPGQQRKVFFVYRPGLAQDGVDEASVTRTFGRPERTATVGPYRVLVWPDGVRPRLGEPVNLP